MTSGLDPRCQAARVWISAATDGEASEAEQAGLRLHLAECTACRSWAALAESVSLQVRTSAPIEPSRPFAFPEPEPEPVLRPSRRRRSPLRARARAAAFASPLLAAAAVAGVLLSGALQTAPQTGQQRQPRQPVITVAKVDAEGFVAGSGNNTGGWDMRPRDTRQQQQAQIPVPRNRDLPPDAVP